MELPKIETIVTWLLENKPETRSDDWILINEFYKHYVDTDELFFATICYNHKEFGLPSFESIRRCRQKVQAKRPDLVDPSTAKRRRKLVEEYEEYAKI